MNKSYKYKSRYDKCHWLNSGILYASSIYVTNIWTFYLNNYTLFILKKCNYK